MREDRHDNLAHGDAINCNLTFKKLNTKMQYNKLHHNNK